VHQDVSQLSTTLQAIVNETTQARTQQEQAASALDARITALTASVEQQVTRLETALQEQGARFDEAQESRRAEFSQQVKEHEAAASASLTKVTSAAETRAAEFDASAKQRLEELDRHQAKAEDILGAIARSGMATGYQTYADEEGRVADRYRKYTIWSAAAVIAVLLWAVLHAAYGEPSTQEVLAKSGVSIALFGLAGYMARQSGNHRDAAQRARNIQLALASIGPYLNELDEPSRQRVIEAFTYVFFAPPAARKTSEPGPGQAQAILEFLRKDETPTA
jgi:hypothetical protein